MSEAVQFGQHPPAVRTIVHLSDTHLVGGGAPLGGVHDADGNLARTLAAIERLRIRPDALVCTGDLTDLGERDAYRRLRAAVEPVAERLDAPIVWVAGNHDERTSMRATLLDAEGSLEPVTGVWDLRGLRLVALDSSVPGWHHGDIDDAQLAWLADVLSEPAPLGTILALHHPPLPSHIPVFQLLELDRQDRLAEVIRGTDVRAILAGHLHHSTAGMFAGVPVSVAASTCYAMDLSAPASRVNGAQRGGAFQLVHVYAETITHSVVDVIDTPAATTFTEEWTQRMAALSPDARREAFSRKRDG